MTRYSALFFIMSVAAALLLGGCGEGKKTSTQVAAKVNKEEISVHQINAVLARTQNLPPEQAKAAGRQVLESLINQEVMVQQAIKDKLERSPQTLQAIARARREILARAYLDQFSAGVPKPGADEVKSYYNQHPELFAERRIYNFNEVAVGAQDGLLTKLEGQLKKARSLAEVAEWLKGQNLPFAANTTTKSAEQLPMELLPRFHQMQVGQIGVIPTKNSILIVQLMASRIAPMDEKAATPFIEQFLFNQRRTEALDKEVKSLRAKAKLEYMGEFVQTAAQGEAAPAQAAAPDVAAKPTATSADSATSTMINKGIADLK